MKRHGDHIRVTKGITAKEGREGNLPTLSIRKNGKELLFFRGSSLKFSDPLTAEDQEFISNLAEGVMDA